MIKVTGDIYLADDFKTLNLVIDENHFKVFWLRLDAYNDRYIIVQPESEVAFTDEQTAQIEAFLQNGGNMQTMKIIADIRARSRT